MKTEYKRISAKTHNRPMTERRLIDAVGTIISRQGYQGLGVNAIAKEAEVSKSLIYTYFKSVDNLIETYILEKDFWMASKNQMTELLRKANKKSSLAEILVVALQKQFDYFFREEEMQQLIIWEISEKSDLMNSVGNAREGLGEDFFELTDRYFDGSDVNLHAIAALLVSGIYYLILHARKNKSKQCGIDIHTEEGRKDILKAIRQIIQWSFTAGKIKQKQNALQLAGQPGAARL
ncbi:MAG: transcriptional regulator BetI [Mucilaginibacter sp.]|nr:transcriptional regulator BetI [Mucilaginibacter sp.]